MPHDSNAVQGQAAPGGDGGILAKLTAMLSDPTQMQTVLEQLSELTDPPDIAQTKAFGQQVTAQALPQGAQPQNPQQGVDPQATAQAQQASLSQLMNPVTQKLGAPQPGGGPVTLPQATGQFDLNRLIQGG